MQGEQQREQAKQMQYIMPGIPLADPQLLISLFFPKLHSPVLPASSLILSLVMLFSLQGLSLTLVHQVVETWW